MPNKHKNAKLRTKLLLSGKLNNKKEVKDTLKYLAEKAAIENEDINYDFENEKNNDFEKLEDGDDDTRKMKVPKKRKLPPNNKVEPKQTKLDQNNSNQAQNESKKVETSIPKKSIKNKYFFMAHPEAIDKNNQILSNENIKNKFVIDEEKLKSIEKKKLTKSKPENGKKFVENKKETSNNTKKKETNQLWVVQECNSEPETEEKEEVKKDLTKKKKKSKNFVLNLDDIDKSFKLKKTIQKLEDGTSIEVLKPVYIGINSDDDEDEDEDDDKSNDNDNENEEQNLQEKESDQDEDEDEENNNENKESENGEKSKEKNKLKEKLESSRFRYLNELLYTQPSSKSYEFFQNDEDSFKAYHEGFKNQISKWPINPLDQIIKYIKSRPANLIVADFGCGEARLAQSVKNKVHSFDLVAVNDTVVKCDMKKVPLESNSCDIVVFCLSLMGTNTVDFLCEAHRVLKQKAVLKIAEVVSRISDKNDFIKNVESIGFKLVSKKDEISNSNTKDYFYFFNFIKMTPKIKKRPAIKLNPCLYKKR